MADKTRFAEGDVFADKAVRLNFTARADADVAPGVDVDDPAWRVMIADDITFLTVWV